MNRDVPHHAGSLVGGDEAVEAEVQGTGRREHMTSAVGTLEAEQKPVQVGGEVVHEASF